MAVKTANVVARVEPNVKVEAENIMEQLGLPVSVVINALYKKIIRTKSIPFSFSLMEEPMARDEMNDVMFNQMMQRGLEEAKADKSRDVNDVFSDLMEMEIDMSE
jgi:addiction module RelB/DinJ family antitoxin